MAEDKKPFSFILKTGLLLSLLFFVAAIILTAIDIKRDFALSFLLPSGIYMLMWSAFCFYVAIIVRKKPDQNE